MFSTISFLRLANLRYLDAYKDGASGSDVVARTRLIKKRHRAPLVMREDQRRRTYKRKRGVRQDEAEEESEYEGEEEGGEEEEEEQIAFDQDEFGEKMRRYLWQHGPNRVHKGLAEVGKGTPCRALSFQAGLSYLVPQLHFEEVASQQRMDEIDHEIELEIAGSIGVTGRD